MLKGLLRKIPAQLIEVKMDSSSAATPITKLGGYDFFKSIGSPQNVVAPMVFVFVAVVSLSFSCGM
jgi:hypothetical protein